MITHTKQDFLNAIEKSKSMTEAAKILGIRYTTFRKYAQIYGVFNPNPSQKGQKKPKTFKCKEDIFKVFDYNVSRFTVKNWYLLENEYRCQKCGIKNWNQEHITLELEHINGNRRDNRIENLRLLCPNCHSQTETWRKKKAAEVVK